jgi:hypothetical protein
LTDFFLYTVTILSGLITIITGVVAIVGYFHHKSASTTQQSTQPASQPATKQQVSVPASQQHIPLPTIPTVLRPSKRQIHLSHPRIALIALIAQVLLFFAVAGITAFTVKSNQLNLFNIISFIVFLGGEGCAIAALVMSLLKTRQLHRWGWFAGNILGFIALFIVFLPALIPLLFGIFGPKAQVTAKAPAAIP